MDVEDSTAALAEDFIPRSCKVFSGRYCLLQHSLFLIFVPMKEIQVFFGSYIEMLLCNLKHEALTS